MKYKIRIEHDVYTVLATNEFNRSLIETYQRLEAEHNQRFADRWLDRMTAFVNGLRTPITLGEIDPRHFSDTYAHYQILATQTTIFFLVEANQIYLVTSGFSGRDWPSVLKTMQPELDRQLKRLKKVH